MKLHSFAVRNSLFILALMMLTMAGVRAEAQTTPENSAAAQTTAVPARITQAVDAARMVQLKGNVHPLARAEFDQGAVSDAMPMKRMMLLLKKSPEQETALQKFMAEQMSKDSPNFQHWLTPQEFGRRFGPADADIQTVTDWLGSQGFTGIKVAPGRNVIEFSGSAGQVRNTFQTDIHKFMVKGEARQSNISDPQIPEALTPVVAGIVSLHNFPTKSMKHVIGEFRKTADGRIEPQFTGSGGSFFALGPADFAKIYNIPAALDGTGGNIAIIGFSDIAVSDAHSFRALFSLPVNDPIVVLNGADPGFTGEEDEAALDVQWSGAVAQKAKIHYILSESTLTSDPLFLGAEYVVDNNSDDVMSLSFGNCEPQLSTATNQFLNQLWEQAAAQGITVTVSAGDNGSAGCDNFNTDSTATTGIFINGIASTPFNVAVGGTDFDDFSPAAIQSTFFATTNGTGKESALGYIHEIPWNDSCAATATSANLTTCVGALAALNNIVAGSGGPSSIYPRPAFQSGIIPNGITSTDAANHRYIPDVSLFASDGSASNPARTSVQTHSNSFYVVCQADAASDPSTSCASTGTFTFFGVGGTSASAPSFAGIIALIGQSEATAGRSRRQGNANVVLYKIATTAANSCNSSTTGLTGSPTCSFYDVTKGNISVPCSGGTSGCSSTTAGTNGVLAKSGTPAFTANAGTGSIPSYDLATGLGSVNVTNLATAWGTAVGSFKGSSSVLLINNSATPAAITHGTPVTAKVTVAAVAPATGTPTGDVSVVAPLGTANGGDNGGTLASGTTTITGVILPGGTYNATAHYAGDGTFGASDSAGVPVVVNKENSTLQMGIVTFDINTGNITGTNAATFPYGSAYILRMDVLNSAGTGTNCQPLGTGITTGCALDATGTVTLKDGANSLDEGTFHVNSEGHTEDQPINLSGGSHPLTAIYNGDNSYNASPIVADTLTVTKATTTTGLTRDLASVTTIQTVTLTATIATQSLGVGPTGTITFSACGTPPCTAPLVPTGFNPNTGTFASATATLPTIFTTTGTKTITATYGGDANYAGSGPSTAVTVTVTSSGSFTVGGSAATVVAGTSGTSTITVTPSNGFTGNVNVTCPTAGLPAGVTCTPNPLAINVAGAAAVTGTLTTNVAAPATTLTASVEPDERKLYAAGTIPSSTGGTGWWALSASTGFATMFLLVLPGRKRRFRAALGLGLVCVLSFSLGCGGSYGGGGGGPVATVTHLTVTASTKVASGGSFAFTAAVTGGTPTGQVQLFDGATALGAPVTVSGGSAPITSNGLSVGTHSISAHYLGTASTQASQSGSLNVTVTGTTTFVVQTTPAASNGSPTVTITIN
jgi:hypothetical protein